MPHTRVALLVLLVVLAILAPVDAITGTSAGTLRYLQRTAESITSLKATWTGTDYCNGWKGVTCAENGDVHINLSNSSLKGRLAYALPEDQADMFVASIDMSHNNGLYGPVPNTLRFMPRIRSLNFSHTSLGGEIPDSIQFPPQMNDIIFNNAQFCGLIPTQIVHNARRFDYSHNRIEGDLPIQWGFFTTLEYVSLEGGMFCGCVPKQWRNSANSALLLAAAPEEQRDPDCATKYPCPRRNIFGPCAPPAGPVDPNAKWTTSTAPPSSTLDPPSTSTMPLPTITTPAPTAAPTTAPTAPPSGMTDTEQFHTRRFLNTFAAAFPKLKESWMGSSMCAAAGVTCATNGDVSVSLAGRNLQGQLPDFTETHAADNIRVVSIDLSNNAGITGPFRSSWGSLNRLRSINLERTSLQGTVPSQWGSLPSLQVVNVASTRASGTLPRWGSPTVISLDLSNNALTGSLPASWGDMRSLNTVRLGGNHFCGCMPSSWNNVPALVNSANNDAPATVRPTCSTVNSCRPVLNTAISPAGLCVLSWTLLAAIAVVAMVL